MGTPLLNPEYSLKLDVYRIVSRAIEEGATIGWRRAHKHTDSPSEDEIKNRICDEVMLALEDVIDFRGLP